MESMATTNNNQAWRIKTRNVYITFGLKSTYFLPHVRFSLCL